MRTAIFDLEHTLFTGDRLVHDGAHELLTILQRLGVTIAGITNDDHRAIVRLEEAGLRGHFATILCADHMATPKALAGVERLLDMAHAKREDTVLVSHAQADILLGRDAGLTKTIAVSHGSASSTDLRRAGADHVVADLAGVLDVLQ